MAEDEKRSTDTPTTPQQSPSPPNYANFPYYPPAPMTPRNDTQALVILVAIVAVIGITVAIPFLLLSNLSGWEDTEWTDTMFDDEVALAPGGNFRAIASYGSADSVIRVFLNVTDGGAVDVYLMTFDQYESIYAGVAPLAYSTVHAWEDVTELNATFDVSMGGDNFYVVVDNVDNPLRPSDAVPTGNVLLDLKVVTTSTYYID